MTDVNGRSIVVAAATLVDHRSEHRVVQDQIGITLLNNQQNTRAGNALLSMKASAEGSTSSLKTIEQVIASSQPGENKFKASRLNDLKNQVNSYFEELGQGRIYDDAGTTPLKLLMAVGGHHRKLIKNKQPLYVVAREEPKEEPTPLKKTLGGKKKTRTERKEGDTSNMEERQLSNKRT